MIVKHPYFETPVAVQMNEGKNNLDINQYGNIYVTFFITTKIELIFIFYNNYNKCRYLK